jgi:hypothetical protein
VPKDQLEKQLKVPQKRRILFGISISIDSSVQFLTLNFTLLKHYSGKKIEFAFYAKKFF